MGLFSKLFGRGDGERPAEPQRDVAALSAPLAVPAIHAVATTEPTRSQLGGTPLGAADFIWPSRQGRPLAFLAQLDLRQLRACRPVDWLPHDGLLLFFYDVGEQPWGFEPDDAGGWRVEHVKRDVDTLRDVQLPENLPAGHRLNRQFLTFRNIRSFPPSESEHVEHLDLNDAEGDAYGDMKEEEFGGHPHHQIVGLPSPIQWDSMQLEAQLASNGINCGEPHSYDTPRAKALADGASDWRLLLQIDSDDRSGMMWGDLGMLYFWIREADARERRFNRTWVVLQCH